MSNAFENKIIIDRSIYDEQFAGSIEGYLQARKNSMESSNVSSYRPPFKNKIIIDRSLYDEPFNSTLENTIKKRGANTRYFSTKRLYQQGDNGYIRTLNNYNINRGVINPNSGSPIDPKSMFNTGLLNVKGYTSGAGGKSAAVGYDGYIQCLTKGNEKTVYLCSSPSEISDNVQVNTASDSAVGMSQDYNFFTGVGSRVVSFSFDVYADYLPTGYSNVISYCNTLRQMNYPTYSSAIVNSPCIRFVYGGISITGIPTITISYDNTIKRGVIDKAKVSVSITETDPIVNGKING